VRLASLRRHWERLSQRDPFWAALTDFGSPRDHHDIDEFFRTGRAEIAAVLHRAEQQGIAVERSRALDFGCGVGRLTQAMAAEFRQCDGVDISASMIRLARRHNRFADRCTYHHNVAADLALFPDNHFDFVYSTLVLQHIEPRYIMGYLREMLRVLAPDGLLVFQLPSHRAVREPKADVPRTRVVERLAPSACRAHLSSDTSVLTLEAGQLFTLTVSVLNASSHTWPSLPDARNRYQINLGNHWLSEDEEWTLRSDGRCPLPHDLAPGSRADLMLGVTAPPVSGTYWLEVDVVQENVAWFAEYGSDLLRIRCTVTGGASGPLRDWTKARGPIPESRPLFRERHPRTFAVLRLTRVRDAYWAWRRAVDHAKTRRDAFIRRRVHPVINWWKGRPFDPKMEMHCVPRVVVLETLETNGGRVINVEEELLPGGFQSYRYWVTRQGGPTQRARSSR
jgi:SAM-dependent methyltransferase